MMSPATPKPISKRALSGRSQGLTPSSGRPPNKKAKENHASGNRCRVCSEPIAEKEGLAHNVCTASSASLLFDNGKIKIVVKRDEKTHLLLCPRCDRSFFSAKKIKEHAKAHAVSSPKRLSKPSPLSLPVSTQPTSATETISIAGSVEDAPQTPPPLLIVSRTQPPSSDTLQTSLLSRYSLVVNTIHRILICLTCQGIIDPSNIRKHFLHHHKNAPTPPNLQHKIDNEASVSYPGLTSSPLHPTETVDAIYGLGDAVSNYRMCLSCRHCFGSKRTFDKHTCASEDQRWIVTDVQRFFANTSSPWFPVRPRAITLPVQPDRWAVYQAQQLSNAGATITPSYSDNFRVLHQFLRNERWLQHVEGFKYEDLIHISSYSSQDTAYGGLHRHIYQFLAATQASLNDPYLRRSIGTRPAEETDQKTVKFHKDVNAPTLENYSRIMAGVICLIHRVILNIDTPYIFPIPNDLTTACTDFVESLSPPSPDREDEPDCFAASDDEIEESSEISDDDEDSSPSQAQSNEHRDTYTSTPSIQIKLVTLLYIIFTQLPDHDHRGQFFTPIYHFLVFSSLRKDGQWVVANTITHTIAALLFVGRLVFASKTLELAQEDNVDSATAFARVSKYFEERTGAIIPRLYITKRGFTGLQSAEESTFFFNAPDLSGTSAIFGNHTLSLSHIKDAHVRAIDEIQAELNALTFHSSHFTISDHVFVHDSPREQKPGYSFLKHPKNVWNHGITLIQYILQNDNLFSKFAYVTSTGSISWNSTAVAEFMKRIFDLQMKFICSIILSYGEPARGTELASHLLANVSGGSIRNFFVLFDIPVLRASFSKTASITGDKVIYRIPLPQIGRQFVRFLAYLRPAFIEWQSYMNPFMLSNAQHYLFAGLYRPITAHDVSRWLAAYTFREINIRLRLRRFRQYMAFITSCNHEVFEAATSSSTATHDQFGHTAEINVMHYGRDSRTPAGSNFSSFLSAARVSGIFHLLYGHPPILLQRLENGQGHLALIKETVNQIRNQSVSPTILTSSSSTSLSIHDISAALKSLILPEIISTLTKSVSKSYASVIELLSPKSTFQISNLSPNDPSIIPHPYLLAKLRELNPTLHQTNGGFKTLQQAQVAKLLHERTKNVVYIAPTGSGKTMPNMICTKFFDVNRSTIWLLPLLALHEQHHHTSRRFGLTSESWSHKTSSSNPPANVLATIDQAMFETFKKFVARLLQEDLLARINIDEAHLVLTHASFRPVMHLLQWVATTPVQIVLTTATLPPSLEGVLLSSLGITSSVTLRATTPRPNISFQVLRTEAPFEEAVQLQFKSALQYSSNNRVILFCLTRREVEQYAKTLGVPYCHAGLEVGELSLILDRFRNDDNFRGLVTSSILGVGLDVPNVSHVLHAGLPRDIISFIQEAGRAERASSDSQAFSLVILPPSLPLPLYPSSDIFGQQILRETLLDQMSCRRLAIQTYLDGTAETCTMLSGSTHICDNCARVSLSPPKLEFEG
ncbi:hypothetical protein AGABI1DRAFT_133300 [Agaricus bisporus var. burnettii JB137-S8]|uniref:DNA 3'-5' helicase n=1 Tax=Agaricus bisporus var. burnettii (strain JB137-S8 / ATCC MYA-4627 / FGSC 10392) TaxID=597362 RepID=K5WV07_AGABU|nr:uncharacterized protein AGABI1DRAFT_133300 [Agaricus bisporus var. burnettii JB137-S8]EKM74407.1 hypothetical protein AGABI1DRAFT_133300 [Agaricus bisporus var. burnettii JB137-S8]